MNPVSMLSPRRPDDHHPDEVREVQEVVARHEREDEHRGSQGPHPHTHGRGAEDRLVGRVCFP